MRICAVSVSGWKSICTGSISAMWMPSVCRSGDSLQTLRHTPQIGRPQKWTSRTPSPGLHEVDFDLTCLSF